jgi:hypothetical protein
VIRLSTHIRVEASGKKGRSVVNADLEELVTFYQDHSAKHIVQGSRPRRVTMDRISKGA